MKEIYLINLKEGEKAIIISIAGGWQATKRLADLGLTPNTQIKISKKAPFWGPVEIEARGSRIVLGRGIASKILVNKI
jgi:Fe2+ transport system protein FeoA